MVVVEIRNEFWKSVARLEMLRRGFIDLQMKLPGSFLESIELQMDGEGEFHHMRYDAPGQAVTWGSSRPDGSAYWEESAEFSSLGGVVADSWFP
ncbi:hypothetical protein U1Q18_009933 [Sarracenia purpurea var. burkii]